MFTRGGDLQHLEQVVALPSRGLGSATSEVVRIAEAQGYSVAATGHGTFRVARTRRPRWAVLAAIVFFPLLGLGLLFLLVKETSSGVITVYEDRSGTKVRLVGPLDAEIAAELRPPDVGAPTAAEAEAIPPREPRTDWSARGSERLAVPPIMDSDLDRTIARRAPRSTGPAVLALPDGRRLPLSSGVVLGRAPTANGSPGYIEIALDDLSLSKTHLAVGPGSDEVMVTDLHSTNGTMFVIDGVERQCPAGQPVAVGVGAELRAGNVSILIQPAP